MKRNKKPHYKRGFSSGGEWGGQRVPGERWEDDQSATGADVGVIAEVGPGRGKTLDDVDRGLEGAKQAVPEWLGPRRRKDRSEAGYHQLG